MLLFKNIKTLFCITAFSYLFYACTIDRILIEDFSSKNTSDTIDLSTNEFDTTPDTSDDYLDNYPECHDAVQIHIEPEELQITDDQDCKWSLDSMLLPDPWLVNIIYGNEIGQGEGIRKVVPYVKEDSDCQANKHGWYYNNEEQPSEIILCPYSCQWFTTVSPLSLRLEIGCETEKSKQ